MHGSTAALAEPLPGAIAVEDLPVPPTPLRVIGVRSSARQNVFSVGSSRPKQTPGREGGDPPDLSGEDVGCRIR